MWTWAALDTLDHFLKNGNVVLTSATNVSKGFVFTLHSFMFTKMLEQIQYWSDFSFSFMPTKWPMSDGMESSLPTSLSRVGVVRVFAIAYCLYVCWEELFSTLRRRHSCCWVRGYWSCIFGYSDNNWLLAPSPSAPQNILKTCEEYAASHNLRFSTHSIPKKCKTKFMAFLSKPRKLAYI